MADQVTLFIIVDHSDSMDGQGLGSANDIAANIVLHFKETADVNPLKSASIKALYFGDGVKATDEASTSSFVWNDISGKGLSNIGDAYELIGKTLEWDSDNIIVLLSDGGFTDDYFSRLSSLLDNQTFLDATRISIAVGPVFDKEQLEYFCGGAQNIYTACEIDEVMNVISRTFKASPDVNATEIVDSSEGWD